jgi:3-hydroxymyristoyl/3-hydroxydecanoyl-(acyl carrier protein) dehydratase
MPGFQIRQIKLVKFLAPVRPADPYVIKIRKESDSLRFECLGEDHIIATGSMVCSTPD